MYSEHDTEIRAQVHRPDEVRKLKNLLTARSHHRFARDNILKTTSQCVNVGEGRD